MPEELLYLFTQLLMVLTLPFAMFSLHVSTGWLVSIWPSSRFRGREQIICRCTCMLFLSFLFMLVARVGSEFAMFLPYMDRFTFMFRCCFAFLCTFSWAQFLFYLYPAQFERDGVLSLWYSSVASKTLIQDIPIFKFQWGTVKQVRECQHDGNFPIGQELVGYIHGSPNHKLILFGRYTDRAWNHHGMLQYVNQRKLIIYLW